MQRTARSVFALLLDGGCDGVVLDCNDDAGFDLQSSLSVDATAGQRFVIVLGGYGGTSSGDYTLSITQPAASETGLCGNGTDDDRDGFADCDDFEDCGMDAACIETRCGDGVDDDGDFVADCEDFDCATDPLCAEKCNDGLDNDVDFYTDCEDPDCDLDPACGGRERCFNGADDDGDGAVDCRDVDCATHPDC